MSEQFEWLEMMDNLRATVFRWSSVKSARTAVLMARHCQQREQSHADLPEGSPEFQEAWDEHWAFASSSINASVMFLEANINEVFLSAIKALDEEDRNTVGGFPYVGGKLDPDEQRRLKGTWKLAESANLLEKYQFVLGLLGKERMNEGAATFQQAKALVDARNKLIHFKDGAYEVGSGPRSFEETLHRLLGGDSFKPHPYTTAIDPFFPNQFFGYAGCRWAWQTADGFAQAFHHELGVEPAYQPDRPSLTLN